MRRDARAPQGTFGKRPPHVDNDGSGGRFIQGLPADHVPNLETNDQLDYDAQAGCPRDVAGGTYTPNVTGAPPSHRQADPRPFKLGK